MLLVEEAPLVQKLLSIKVSIDGSFPGLNLIWCLSFSLSSSVSCLCPTKEKEPELCISLFVNILPLSLPFPQFLNLTIFLRGVSNIFVFFSYLMWSTVCFFLSCNEVIKQLFDEHQPSHHLVGLTCYNYKSFSKKMLKVTGRRICI